LAPVSLGGNPAVVGLDIGTDHVRAAHLKPAGGGYSLGNYGIAPMPLGAVVEGEVVDPDHVSAAIKDLWRHGGFRSKDVSIGLSNQKVVVRLIDLPYMEKAELKGAIQYQAQDYIPIPVEEAVLDFQVLGDYMTPGDEHMMEVLLVAAQRDMVNNIVRAVEGAGLRLSQIDVTAFALVRSLLGSPDTILPGEAEEGPGEATGIVHITSGLTNIVVVDRGVPRFVRVSSLAGNQFTQAVASALNLTIDEAEALKNQVGLPAPDGQAQAGFPLDERTKAAQDALEREMTKFVAEVRRSLDYYLTQATQSHVIRRILLSGSGAMLRHLPTHLERGLQTQVLIGDPLSRVTTNGSGEQLIISDRMGSAAAIGLAMGGVD
jgi:type IV pilus assembly protein PilM